MTAGGAGVPTVPGGWLSGSAPALQRDQLGTYLEAMHTYGDHVRFRVGPPGLGFTFDTVFRPEGARQVLASRGDSYVKDAPIFAEFAHLLGDGLATSEGDRWLRHRRILQPLFTRQHIEGVVGAVAEVSDELVAGWRAGHAEGGVVDLADASMRYALRALGRTILGGDDLESALPVLRWSLPVMNEHATRRGLAAVRLPRWLPTPANRRAERARRAVHGVVDELIRQRREQQGGEDLLSLLLAARDPETGATLDDADVRDEVLVFLVAGHETTGTALALILHLLGRHEQVQRRVRAEVRRVVGARRLQAPDLQELRYTRQVVREALRLYPPIHTLVRRSVDGADLLGSRVPPGRIVAVSVWGIHRNPDVWPDPGRFDPDRFGPEAPQERDHYAHLPFGAGPRSCIGVHLGMAELVIAVASVVRAFRLTSPDEQPAVEAGITLHPSGVLSCRLEPTGKSQQR